MPQHLPSSHLLSRDTRGAVNRPAILLRGRLNASFSGNALFPVRLTIVTIAATLWGDFRLRFRRLSASRFLAALQPVSHLLLRGFFGLQRVNLGLAGFNLLLHRRLLLQKLLLRS
uniref:(northern house mosquito) hypothetical protein n=1 Tax=Culex pipiens TaxID=7175 RepID=A0A8D8AXE0_CULPI